MWGDFLEKETGIKQILYPTGPMFVIQCQVFRFQYSLAEPDIQFVKVVFAMRLEFGLNIFS